MRKELVQENHGIALTTLFILGNASVAALGGYAERDLWLSFLLAIAVASIVVTIYSRLRSLLPGENLFEGLECLFGKWPSRFLSLAYAGYAWRLAGYVASDLSDFIRTISLRNTPKIVIVLGFVTLAIWGVKAGIEVLARWSSVFIKAVLAALSIAFVLLLTRVDLLEFLPVLYNGFKPVVLGALQLLDFPFLEAIVLFWAFDQFTTKQSPYKIFLPGLLIAGFILLLLSAASIAVLGSELYRYNYFPIFVAVSRIDLANFVTRLEAVAGIAFSIGGFLKIAVCLLVASKGLAYGFGFSKYRFLVTPLALSIIPASQWLIKTIMEFAGSANKVVGPSDFLFQVLLPLILWGVAEIKMFSRRKSNFYGTTDDQ